MSLTIKDIAKQCGVGVSTVSRALNDHPDINQETKQKILKVVQENSFIPNNSARNLKRNESKTIAVIVKEIQNPFFATMLSIMETQIRKRGYDFYIRHVGKKQDEVEEAVQQVAERKVKGIIFLGGDFKKQEKKLAKIQVPYVASTVKIPDKAEGCGSFVAIDDRAESCKIVDYLCSKGRKNIAILASDKKDTNIGKARLEGYRDALKANKIKEEKTMVCYLEGKDMEYSMENGYLSAKRLISEHISFDVLFAISDLMAIGAAKALAEEKIKVPEEVLLAGFDGIDYTRFYEPEITTVQQPVEAMALESVNSLFEMIDTGQKVEGKILPAELVKRKSTEGVR